jgi:hypothetical protein
MVLKRIARRGKKISKKANSCLRKVVQQIKTRQKTKKKISSFMGANT